MDYPEAQPVRMPNGDMLKGFDIPITKSSEQFNEYTLDDGTVLRAKLVANGIIRAKDQWDKDGNPLYILMSQNVVRVIEVHPSLRLRR